MMKRYFLIVFSLITLSLSAQKQWTLRECVDYAIEHNIEFKQQILQVKGAEVDVNTAKMSRLPNLNATVGSGLSFGSSQSPSTGTYESANSFGAEFGVTTIIPVFTGFRIPNEIKSQEFNLLAATANLFKAKENLELQITSLYLEVLFKKELLKVYEEQFGLTSKQLDKTVLLVEAGKVPRSQEFDMLSQQAKDEMNITMSKNDLDISLLNLSQALNLQEYDSFDVVEPEIDRDQVLENASSLILPSEIYNIATAIKPHVKVAEYDLESSKSKLKVAKSTYYPTLDFRMSYQTGYSYLYGKRTVFNESLNAFEKVKYNNPSFGSQFNNNAREYIGISLSIPIFNRFQTRNQVRTAQLNIENNELALDNVKLALYKEIQQAYQSATAAQAKFTSTEKAYSAAEESYMYAEQRYEIGKLSVFEFNEAQTKLLTSKSEQVQAKYDFIFRAKILDFYRGEEIDIE